MASNSFGKIFKITTWGESHGKAIGVVIDGCPAGVEIDQESIQKACDMRAPGKNIYTSPRTELDKVKILSGVFEGKSTGAPISIMIENTDCDSSKYEEIKDKLRPGHANFTYFEKYGTFDYKGGGRASGRETATRVAAGAIAKKILEEQGIHLFSYIKQIGTIEAIIDTENLREKITKSPLFCPDEHATKKMIDHIDLAKKEGDSLGGIVEFLALGLPSGLGDPVFEKLGAVLAFAMMGIPATKGFELGSGFSSVRMKGSEHNDEFILNENKIETRTNFAGGTLGGISTGMPLCGRIAFKPTSSIKKEQQTYTFSKEKTSFTIPEGSRHDPCLAIRAVPVVEAMLGLVLVDALLMNRNAQ